MRAVNLLPRKQKRKRKPPSAIVQLCLLAPFVLGGLLAAGFLLQSSKVNDRRATLEALRAELAALPAPLPQPQVDPQLAVQRDLHVAALSTALQSRLAWDRILRQVSAVLPEDVWLTNLSAHAPTPAPATPAAPATTTTATTTTTTGSTTTSAPPPPAPVPAVGPLTITGYTYSQEGVARLLGRLAVVPALQNVELVQSSRTALVGRDVFSFAIHADVRPGETG